MTKPKKIGRDCLKLDGIVRDWMKPSGIGRNIPKSDGNIPNQTETFKIKQDCRSQKKPPKGGQRLKSDGIVRNRMAVFEIRRSRQKSDETDRNGSNTSKMGEKLFELFDLLTEDSSSPYVPLAEA